ncbi:Endonuclease/exonuclease/phosphatase [Russula aff. rugulosa BPL654]|nr:Endonuclease/exonuclease/phosphatase [Russula aff. rugulosa BPL654]
MPGPGTFTPTPEQLALREARRLAKERAAANATSAPPKSLVNNEKGQIVPRPWLAVQDSHTNTTHTVKIMTWNVRRELFPDSDCLKSTQREHMLFKEIISADADILCLQEVDRLEKLIPVLEEANYGHVYAAGPRKKHGCLIGFRRDFLAIRDQFVLHYDDIDIRNDHGTELSRKGLSFRTKNIANIVVLERLGQPGEGYIVATTHLFWHPSQAGILLREVVKYRESSGLLSWPCFLAGGGASGKISRLHVSVDPTVPLTNPAAANDDEDGSAEADPDRVITNAREASPIDGLLNSYELSDLFAVTTLRPRSLYDEGQRLLETISSPSPVPRCGERVGLPPYKRGAYEPEWTSYTHYWQSVLDYIWVIDPPNRRASIMRLLQPHRTENLHPGLPRKGISGSDHVSLAAEVQWDGIH